MHDFTPTFQFSNRQSSLSILDRRFMVESLAHCVGSLRGKTILLTGGTGFFGKWLLESYIALKDQFDFSGELVILSRHPEQFLLNNPFYREFEYLTIVQGDVRDALIPCSHFDYIIHAATEASATLERDNPDEMYSVIVEGTQNILDIALRTRASRFLLTSSGAVYGPQPSDVERLPESFPLNPVTAYGKGKKRAEELVLNLAEKSGITGKIARCFAFVGPFLNLDIHFAIGNFIRNGLNHEPIVIRGDGTPYRSYLYAAELVVWLWKILLGDSKSAIFNVGSPESVSIQELAVRVNQTFQHEDNLPAPLEVQVLQTHREGVPVQRYVPDVSRIDRELELRPQISLEEGVRRTLQFHRTKR